MPTSQVKKSHPVHLRQGIDQLNKRFDTTHIGKILNKVLTKKAVNQTRILMEMNFEEPVKIGDLYESSFVTTKGKLSKEGERLVGGLVVVYSARSKAVEFKGIGPSGRVVAQLLPFNKKYRPERVNLQIYCIFLINIFRSIAQEYGVAYSTPSSFKRISGTRIKKPTPKEEEVQLAGLEDKPNRQKRLH